MFKNKLKSTVAIVLAAAVVVSGITVGVVSYLKHGTTIEIAQGEPDGMTVSGVHARGLALKVSPLAETEVSEGEIMTDSAYTIEIVPDPVDADDTYLWTATDTTNITLSPAEDTKSCTVTCNNAFGTPITLTVVSNINADVGAEFTLDYVKAITAVTITSPKTIAFSTSGTDYTISATPTYGTGTITPDTFTITGGKLKNNLTGLTEKLTNKVGNTYYSRTVTYADRQFTGTSLSITTPWNTFITGTTTSEASQLNAAVRAESDATISPLVVQLGTPTVAQLTTAYNNSVKTKATNTAGDGTLTINYTYSHLGVSLGSSSVSLDVAFNISAMTVNAVNVDTDTDHIIFF